MGAYLLFFTTLPLGFIVAIATGFLFGFFSLIQWIVIFTQLMRYLNRIKPTSILTGTSFQSVSHHFLHGICVYAFHWILKSKNLLGDFFVFFLILTSMFISNAFAWKLNRDLKLKKINLDSPE